MVTGLECLIYLCLWGDYMVERFMTTCESVVWHLIKLVRLSPLSLPCSWSFNKMGKEWRTVQFRQGQKGRPSSVFPHHQSIAGRGQIELISASVFPTSKMSRIPFYSSFALRCHILFFFFSVSKSFYSEFLLFVSWINKYYTKQCKNGYHFLSPAPPHLGTSPASNLT